MQVQRMIGRRGDVLSVDEPRSIDKLITSLRSYLWQPLKPLGWLMRGA